MAQRQINRVLALASADSHVKWCQTVAGQLAGEGGQVDLFIPTDAGHDADALILANMGVTAAFTSGPLDSLPQLVDLSAYDLVTTILTPPLFARFHTLMSDWVAQSETRRRPVILTGFPGISLKITMGLVTRQGADVICLNTAQDLAYARELSDAMGFDPTVLTRTGYPFVLHTRRQDIVTQPNAGRTIVFTTQPHWPQKRQERLYILRKLVEAATRYPNDKVVVKLRLPPDKRSVHPEKHHYEEIFPQLNMARPANFTFVYGPMDALFAQTDLHLTLASTAAVESIAMGIPTAIIGDFGPHEGYGVNYFVGAGLIRTIEAAIAENLPPPNSDWLETRGFSPQDTLHEAKQMVQDQLVIQKQAETVTPLRTLMYTPANFPSAFQPSVVRAAKSRSWKWRLWTIANKWMPPVLSEHIWRLYMSKR